jgi:hypothetical protein
MQWADEDDATLCRMRNQSTTVGAMALLLGRPRAEVQRRITLQEWQESQWGAIAEDEDSSVAVMEELQSLNKALSRLEAMVDRVVADQSA